MTETEALIRYADRIIADRLAKYPGLGINSAKNHAWDTFRGDQAHADILSAYLFGDTP